jgi:DNA-binding transcriptional ArsR family regulator
VGHGAAAEGLQAGSVSVEAELAIPKGNLPGQVVPLEVVPSDQGVPVYRRLGSESHPGCQEQKQRALHGLSSVYDLAAKVKARQSTVEHHGDVLPKAGLQYPRDLHR